MTSLLRKSVPNFIILSGSGRMVGKTFMGSALIRAFSDKFPLLALKISPHIHDSLGNTKLRSTSAGIRIFEDLGPHHKSSGQFLESGATQSYFMETNDEHIAEAFDLFIKECNPLNLPVVCESGALGRLIKPGILIFITHSHDDLPEHKLTTLHWADLVLPAKTFSAREVIQKISFPANGWRLG
jgi:hypothetical protein